MAGQRGEMDFQTPDLWPTESLAHWRSSPLSAMEAWLTTVPADTWETRSFRVSARKTYYYIFKAWYDFLANRKIHVLEASSRDMEAFLAEKAELEPVSRLRYLQLLDRVYTHLIHVCQWPGKSPCQAALAQATALNAPPREVLTPPEMAALIEVLTAIPGFKGARDRAMAALLLGAGLRVGELIALPWSTAKGIRARSYQLVVEPQGIHRNHTTCLLPDGPWRTWWEEWETAYAPGPTTLVAIPSTQSGRPYSPSGVFRRVGSWLLPAESRLDLAAGITHLASGGGQQGPNLLRNTFAWFALERYAPEQVMEFLGHNELRHVTALLGSRPAASLRMG